MPEREKLLGETSLLNEVSREGRDGIEARGTRARGTTTTYISDTFSRISLSNRLIHLKYVPRLCPPLPWWRWGNQRHGYIVINNNVMRML